MYALIVYRPLFKPWKKITLLENRVAYVNLKGRMLEVMYRESDKTIKTEKYKVFKVVKLITEDDNYNRMNGRFK